MVWILFTFMGIITAIGGTTIVLSKVRWMYGVSAINDFERLITELERAQMAGYDRLERRSGQDRRDHQVPLLKSLFFKGVRESVRRAEDRKRIVALDRYNPSLFIPIILVLSLSLLDALLTLTLIAQGARELNPVMQYYLSHGPQVFLLVKYGLTAASVLIIVLVNESLSTRYRLRNTILSVFAAVFGCVVIWELYLLSI